MATLKLPLFLTFFVKTSPFESVKAPSATGNNNEWRTEKKQQMLKKNNTCIESADELTIRDSSVSGSGKRMVLKWCYFYMASSLLGECVTLLRFTLPSATSERTRGCYKIRKAAARAQVILDMSADYECISGSQQHWLIDGLNFKIDVFLFFPFLLRCAITHFKFLQTNKKESCLDNWMRQIISTRMSLEKKSWRIGRWTKKRMLFWF